MTPGLYKVIAFVPLKDASVVNTETHDFSIISINDLPPHFNKTLYPGQIFEVNSLGEILKSLEDRRRHAELLNLIAMTEGDGKNIIPDYLKKRLAEWWEELARYQPVDPTAKTAATMRTNASVDWSKTNADVQ